MFIQIGIELAEPGHRLRVDESGGELFEEHVLLNGAVNDLLYVIETVIVSVASIGTMGIKYPGRFWIFCQLLQLA